MQWHRDGLGIPECVRAASSDYMSAHDDVALWVDERCERAGETKASLLYADFHLWKTGRGERAPAIGMWSERVLRIDGITKRQSNGIRYSPIALRVTT